MKFKAKKNPLILLLHLGFFYHVLEQKLLKNLIQSNQNVYFSAVSITLHYRKNLEEKLHTVF